MFIWHKLGQDGTRISGGLVPLRFDTSDTICHPRLSPQRWQGNGIRREPQATENPVTRFPSGGDAGEIEVETETETEIEIECIHNYVVIPIDTTPNTSAGP